MTAAQSRGRAACPLCGLEEPPERLLQHLQTAHRKSSVSRKLLEERGTAPGSSGTDAASGT